MNYLYLKGSECEYWINLAKIAMFYREKVEKPFSFTLVYDNKERIIFDGIDEWEAL